MEGMGPKQDLDTVFLGVSSVECLPIGRENVAPRILVPPSLTTSKTLETSMEVKDMTATGHSFGGIWKMVYISNCQGNPS